MPAFAKKKKPRAPSPSFASVTNWAKPKKAAIRFSAIFLGLVAVFCFAACLPAWQRVVEKETALTARLAYFFLSPVGSPRLEGSTIFQGSQPILEVKSVCSGLHYCIVFLAAVLAFPARWSLRLTGILAGVLVLLSLSLTRVISLFIVGSYIPAWFDVFHEQVWSLMFIVAVLALLSAWVLVAQRQSDSR